MKSSAFLNGVTLQDFFPLISKLSQQIRLPVTVIGIEVSGGDRLDQIGIVELATITIAPSGSVSSHSTLVMPEVPITAAAVKTHGLRLGELAGSPKFPIVYDSLSRTFASSLIVGLSADASPVPVIYGNMVRYGLPIMSARHQLDLLSIHEQKGGTPSSLQDLAKHYSVTPGTARRSPGNVLTMARVLESMLWRHGSDAVLACIKSTTTSYLTPVDVLGNRGGIDGQPEVSQPEAPARKPAVKPTENATASWIVPLKKAIADVIERHGVVRPVHLKEIAEAMEWTESRTSIDIGRLLTRGKIKPEPFLIAEQQELLKLHLPIILKDLKEVKLKAVREAIKELTGHDVEYIQIRLALKKLGQLLD